MLRDGHVVADRPLGSLEVRGLVELMLGRPLESKPVVRSAPQPIRREPLLSGRGLFGKRLHSVDIDIYPGEVVGIAGLIGSGRSELARLLAGAQRPVAGTFVSGGRRLSLRSAHDAIANGIVSVPQDRRREGCLLDLSLRENLTLGDLSPFSRRSRLSRRRERVEVARLIEAFDIRPREPERPLRLFSGGNQQKAALARAVRLNPRMLVLDEPTQGIDIGAREEIGTIVRRLRGEDVAIVLASSDSEELLELADRVIVLHRGRIATTIAQHELTRDRLAVALTTGRREAA